MRAHTIATACRPRGMARLLVVALVLGVSALVAVLVSASGLPADAPVEGWPPEVHQRAGRAIPAGPPGGRITPSSARSRHPRASRAHRAARATRR